MPEDNAYTGPRRRVSLRARVRYRFDLALARGPLVVIGYLGVVMLAVIVFAASVLTLFHLTGLNGNTKDHLSFREAFWQSLLRVLDTGTFASDQHWFTRLMALFVTLTGIFLAGSLIGLIATAVDQRISDLRKGRGQVIESGHTLVLGWSPRLAVILSEIAIANENHRHQALVVLAGLPKDEMEDELRRLVPDTKGTRVVCRTGDPADPRDLELVNAREARSVIVLAGEHGDAGVVKTVLAVRSIDPDAQHTRVVAEISSDDIARTLRSLTHGRVAIVQSEDVIVRVTAQACHQAGLADVFKDLLDFDGDEIYFARVPELSGHTFLEAMTAFELSSVIGVCRGGAVTLNPGPDFVFADGDEVIAVAADDDAIAFTGFAPPAGQGPVAPVAPYVPPVQRIAFVGWSRLGHAVVDELDDLLGVGSEVDVIVDRRAFEPTELSLPTCRRCTVRAHAVDPGPSALVELITASDYDQVIVLGYRNGMADEQADAHTMLTLLALHDAWSEEPGRRPRVVAEMLDRADVAIAQTTGVDDFIISDDLTSLMIAQLSERLELQAVFHDLLDGTDCVVSPRPASLYTSAEPTPYAAIVATAGASGESVIGYRISGEPARLNPPKSMLLRLGADDDVLVLVRPAAFAEPAAPPAAMVDAEPLPVETQLLSSADSGESRL